MIIFEILKWIGTAMIILFGSGCVLAAIVVITIVFMAGRQDEEEEEQGELPFYCVITDKECKNPCISCTECEIYKQDRRR